MVNADRRRVLSLTEFNALSQEETYPLDRYYDVLILENQRITDEVFRHAERFGELTSGQRMLIQLGTFDSQTGNGGVTQFFWNYPQYAFDVADWISQLRIPQLQSNYDRALEALVGSKDQWLTLRREFHDDPDYPNWEPFRQTYELLDLNWFDRAYFDSYRYNDKDEFVGKSPGLNQQLVGSLVDYIRQHPDEFIIDTETIELS